MENSLKFEEELENFLKNRLQSKLVHLELSLPKQRNEIKQLMYIKLDVKEGERIIEVREKIANAKPALRSTSMKKIETGNYE